MKHLIKGVALGLTLNFANRFCGFLFGELFLDAIILFSTITMGIIITAFLISDDAVQLIICGVTGLFTMLLGETFIFSQFSAPDLTVYLGGFCGSLFAVVVALILTANHFKPSKYFHKDEIAVSPPLKLKLILYAGISAISFSYLVLPEQASLSVPFFTLLQVLMLWRIVPNKKRLLFFVPIFIMSLNCFISASNLWKMPNFILSILLYGYMLTDVSGSKDAFLSFKHTFTNLLSSFTRFLLPFRWVLEHSNKKMPMIKRVVIAVALSLPCAILLTLVLSRADMVFSLKTEGLLNQFSSLIGINPLCKGIIGIIAGLFLFGLAYNAHKPVVPHPYEPKQHKGDLIIINVFLSTILLVYTLFVIIQFRYLFAGSALPQGLTYTQYARKGFFELLVLTGVNILTILVVTKLTQTQKDNGVTFCKALCHYLCAVTIVLLISSFYRMFLYTGDDGLTRMRFFVMGFLVFEAMGLILTFFYISKPKFNIVLVYTTLALIYYSLLNLVPTDNIIAQNQIDKYLKGEREDIDYIFTLSADAVPSLEHLYQNTQDEQLKKDICFFIDRRTCSHIPKRWQRYNLPLERANDFQR